jgi:acyl-CoA thioesterase-1
MRSASSQLRIFAATAILVALAGCRADAGKPDPGLSAQTTTATVPAAANADRPVLVCFGDSLTAGYGVDPGDAYPDYLQQLMDENDFHYRVDNEGVSGDTTKDGLARVGLVLEQHPKVVVVEFGGNDGLRGLPLAQTQANLDTIIAKIEASGAKVVIAGITLPPDYGPDYIHRFNAIYPALATKYHVRLLPFLLQNVFGVPGEMQADRTHATAVGNRQVAQNVFTLVKPLLVQ